MPGLFVTGAGTDIGKTYVSTVLLRQMQRHGRSLIPYKPVLSGFDPHRAEASDIGQLLRAANLPCDSVHLAMHAPWRFAAPLAPDQAARQEGRTLHFHEITQHLIAARARCQAPLLVEGAGGILSPLTMDATNRDLALALNLPVLCVTGSYLGAISHGLCTLEVLKAAGLRVALTVICESADSHVSLEETRKALQRFSPLDAPIVALPRQPLDRAAQSGHDIAQMLLNAEIL